MKKALILTTSILSLSASLTFAAGDFGDAMSDDASNPYASSASRGTPTAEESTAGNNTQKQSEGWGAWATRHVTKVAQWSVEAALRSSAGCVTAAYGTPYLNPAVTMAGTLAENATYYGVTWATGLTPAGWVAGKVVKIGVLGAGYYAAPAVAFAIGYNGKEVAQAGYAAGEALYAGGKALYKGASSLMSAAASYGKAASSWYSSPTQAAQGLFAQVVKTGMIKAQ